MSRRIVIIGGMGPQASLELHRRLLRTAANRGAVSNDDFPEIVHISIPVLDFISSGSQTVGLKHLKRSLALIKFMPGDQVVLACNTAHVLQPEIEDIIGMPIISLIDAVVNAVKQENCVGLLASPTTIKSGLYSKRLRAKLLLPTEQEMEELEAAIRYVIANNQPRAVLKQMESLVEQLNEKGAQRVILGCTELSVIFAGTKNKLLVDPLDEICKLIKL